MNELIQQQFGENDKKCYRFILRRPAPVKASKASSESGLVDGLVGGLVGDPIGGQIGGPIGGAMNGLQSRTGFQPVTDSTAPIFCIQARCLFYFRGNRIAELECGITAGIVEWKGMLA